jgi:hypothetical protein
MVRHAYALREAVRGRADLFEDEQQAAGTSIAPWRCHSSNRGRAEGYWLPSVRRWSLN